MPRANATVYNSYSNINNLLAAPNLSAFVAPSYPCNGTAFSSGDLVAISTAGDATDGYLVAYDYSVSTANVLLGIILDDVAATATDARVVIMGTVNVSAIDFTGLEVESAQGFVSAPNVNATLLNSGAFQNNAVIKIDGIGASNPVAASLFIDGAAANGGLTFTAVNAGVGGNDIQIVLADAGSASVVVDGLTITVTPASGANTAGDVVTQVEASVAASNLVTVVAEGDGTGEPGTDAGSNLEGGLN